jgi:hypothetical protein
MSRAGWPIPPARNEVHLDHLRDPDRRRALTRNQQGDLRLLAMLYPKARPQGEPTTPETDEFHYYPLRDEPMSDGKLPLAAEAVGRLPHIIVGNPSYAHGGCEYV